MKENHEHPANERDDVATLVRLAGKRQAVPRDRSDRVRAAARTQWQREVRRRTRRRYFWTAAGLAAAASLALVIAFRVVPIGTVVPAPSDGAILVEALTGAAWSRDALSGETPEARALVVGDEVDVGSELGTAPDGRAAIRLPSGHSVRLDASTRIRLLEGGSLSLDRGAVYVDSGSRETPANSLDVHTRFGVIQEIGTQFEVRLETDSVRVRLREGAVVARQDDRAYEVQVGTELGLGSDGTVTRRAISTHGPEWAWFARITPMLDLEGRSVREFLHWVARERGLRLAFADGSLARSADEIVLSGTTERLTLEETLDAVLPASRMTYRVEHGVLVIAAVPEER